MAHSGFEDYYLRQAGNGLPVFVGGRMRGRGIGNVLGGLARMFIPVLKRTGKTLLKHGLRTGVDVLGDVVLGEDIKSSASRRIRQSGSRLLNQASRSIAPQTLPPGQPARQRGVKRKRGSKPHQSKRRATKRKRSSRDIFN